MTIGKSLSTRIYTYQIPAKNQPWTLIAGAGLYQSSTKKEKKTESNRLMWNWKEKFDTHTSGYVQELIPAHEWLTSYDSMRSHTQRDVREEYEQRRNGYRARWPGRSGQSGPHIHSQTELSARSALVGSCVLMCCCCVCQRSKRRRNFEIAGRVVVGDEKGERPGNDHAPKNANPKSLSATHKVLICVCVCVCVCVGVCLQISFPSQLPICIPCSAAHGRYSSSLLPTRATAFNCCKRSWYPSTISVSPPFSVAFVFFRVFFRFFLVTFARI